MSKEIAEKLLEQIEPGKPRVLVSRDDLDWAIERIIKMMPGSIRVGHSYGLFFQGTNLIPEIQLTHEDAVSLLVQLEAGMSMKKIREIHENR